LHVVAYIRLRNLFWCDPGRQIFAFAQAMLADDWRRSRRLWLVSSVWAS
jgi:hypothetical protein